MALIIDKLIGRKIIEIKAKSDERYVACLLDNEDVFVMKHEWGCCESVWLEDGYTDFKELLGEEIIMAECVEEQIDDSRNRWDDLCQFTFYKFGTLWRDATLRFIGTSNGYYSVDVDCSFNSDFGDDEDYNRTNFHSLKGYSSYVKLDKFWEVN